MQFKNLVTSALFLGLSVSSVLAGHGRVTYYESAPSSSHPGACGRDYLADYYIAINGGQYSDSLCGRCVKIVYNNKYLVGKLIDECPGCPSGGLDISPSMFQHFAAKSKGIFNADWEYVSCDNYGKKGTCSGSDCGMSSSSSDSKKTTTTTSKKIATSTKVVNVAKSTPVSASTTTVVGKTTQTATVATATVSAPANSTTNAQATTANSTPNATTINGNANEVNKGVNNNDAKEKTVPENENAGEENSSSIALPLTGALMVSGAAGIGLIYLAKSKRESVQDLKQKFPDAFKNIKRSLTKKKTPTTNDVSNTTNVTTDSNERDISETRITIN